MNVDKCEVGKFDAASRDRGIRDAISKIKGSKKIITKADCAPSRQLRVLGFPLALMKGNRGVSKFLTSNGNMIGMPSGMNCY